MVYIIILALVRHTKPMMYDANDLSVKKIHAFVFLISSIVVFISRRRNDYIMFNTHPVIRSQVLAITKKVVFNPISVYNMIKEEKPL